MDYTIKLQTHAVSGPLFVCMAQQTHADDRASATVSKFYLPAGGTPSVEAGRFERLWTMLFDHSVGPAN